MKIAYGYNRDPKEFEHIDYDGVKLFIDHNGTREQLDGLINGDGAREGDALYVLSVGDLGKGRAAHMTRKEIEAKGVSVVICEPPIVKKPALPRGRPAYSPDDNLHADGARMWGNPIRYTQKYVLDYVSGEYGETVTRNQMNKRHGNRYKKDDLK